MTMSVQDLAFRPTFRAPRGRRGFSLIELLAVIVILSIVFVLGGGEISHAWKRQKLQSASTDIKVILQRALPEMQRRNMRTWVQIGPLVNNAGVRYLPITLNGDVTGNGPADCAANPPSVACPNLLIDEYDIMVIGKTGTKGTTGVSQDFCLSSDDGSAAVNLTSVQSVLWSDNTLDWNNARSIMCDFQGRAIDVVTGRQLTGSATFVLTHADVVLGNLSPATRFVMNINPVWSVRVRKQIKDSGGTWVDHGGG